MSENAIKGIMDMEHIFCGYQLYFSKTFFYIELY